MSADVPTFTAATPSVSEQMSAALLSSYIAYSGPCTIDEAAGKVTLKVEAAWRRITSAPSRFGSSASRTARCFSGRPRVRCAAVIDPLTRRLTLERVP